jgi:hypothetical protein
MRCRPSAPPTPGVGRRAPTAVAPHYRSVCARARSPSPRARRPRLSFARRVREPRLRQGARPGHRGVSVAPYCQIMQVLQRLCHRNWRIRGVEVDQPAAKRVGDRRGTVSRTQLAVDVLEMGAHRRWAHHQSRGDLLGREAPCAASHSTTSSRGVRLGYWRHERRRAKKCPITRAARVSAPATAVMDAAAPAHGTRALRAPRCSAARAPIDGATVASTRHCRRHRPASPSYRALPGGPAPGPIGGRYKATGSSADTTRDAQTERRSHTPVPDHLRRLEQPLPPAPVRRWRSNTPIRRRGGGRCMSLCQP